MEGRQLLPHESGPQCQKGLRIQSVEGADIRKELYIGLAVDRVSQRVTLMASSECGTEIEEVAEKTPELIHKIIIDPIQGLTDADADALATKIGVPQASLPAARQILHGL